MTERIKQLVEQLNRAAKAYYQEDREILSNQEYDALYDELAALEKKTGARALRAILEEFMLDIMYEIPKDENIGRVVITRDYIEHKGGPLITMRGVPLLHG